MDIKICEQCGRPIVDPTEEDEDVCAGYCSVSEPSRSPTDQELAQREDQDDDQTTTS